jgi:hypothetical protein
MHKIILPNQIEIECELNGNNYIPASDFEESLFDNVKTVKIVDEELNEVELNHFKIVFTKVIDKKSIVFIQKTKDEIETEKLWDMIDYLVSSGYDTTI